MTARDPEDDMPAEADIRGGVRGKFYKRYYDGLSQTTANDADFKITVFKLVPPLSDPWLPRGSQESWKRGVWA